MSAREMVLRRARHTYADDYADTVALCASSDREAATALAQLLRDGGFWGTGVRIRFTAKTIDYEVDGEAGHLTYLDLAREIRSAQMSLFEASS